MSHDTVLHDIDHSKPASEDPSRLRTFFSILRRFIGVTDIATARFSLPAQLLEPTPNLEYWNYLDRPENFISIGKSDDELGRMLEVLRFWFTKDVRYVQSKPCKPYNSVLGEFFRCYWETEDYQSPVLPNSAEDITAGVQAAGNGEKVKISYLTEQTSHHPPVSAFYADCPQRGIIARGFDQITAKFSGTSIRIAPGKHNLGIFLNLQKRDNEEYRLTHPAAHIGGWLRGSLSISVSDTCYITCPKTRIKTILQYLEDGWLGRSHYRVVGVIFRYDPENDDKRKIKEVPESDVLATIDGSWHEQVYYTLAGSVERHLLIDIAPLFPSSKVVPPEEKQLSNESRRCWSGVTAAIHSRQYTLATQKKHELEERQRVKAAIRMERNHEWKPRFFMFPVDSSGRPELTADGRKVLERLQQGDYTLEEKEVV
ncbi:oxysterol-binding protein [Coccidioides immitis RS]|uniref:Oxysterol-binding protein n=7 Tax=Coccidioides TaxID=5500 RepID=J3KKL9_COCIM|nr:oxysterol-binding protein [Coccidioides immitis RS]XP_003065269.1 Oxysterol-binding family protein [Coccidioides posadasii C735 delta SOWgp]EFW16859.1 oxysterol binding protein [Coccidioides posadasii str. Silveira]KMM64381.1 OBPa [Coccidioides posadasii RMSCC 3488]KMP02102.1 hypothetical protein CIRG_02241 [Coccidioides immitis RMSCC 2394]KMU79793.1 OBPa [Coccidioides immitis RMSCC 3703]KMU88279.1 GH25973p [Coccidioides immitis H538.4]TPX25167.1 hypothetical protein DIZ76_010616 [Coccidi|eukprot:XP_003065269.1 Oxysterol-binding family protein [Coccidioides posadasii C735 delta SOWgp]